MVTRDLIPEDLQRRVEPNGHAPLIITAAELMDKDFEPIHWAVPDILPAGVSILAAKPKIGKSWLAYGLCVAVASGGMALGAKLVEKGEALYLALEDNQRRLKKRLKVMLGGDTAPTGLHLATEWSNWDDGGVQQLDTWLGNHPDARLVVIDTLKKVRPRRNGNRNVYDVDYEALEPLLPVAAEHNVAILVIHHSNKMVDPTDPFDVISGSTGLTGGVDGVLVLSRERGTADAFLYVDGRDVEEQSELALTWSPDNASWTLAGNAEEYRLNKERAELIKLLTSADEPMGPKDVADAIGKSDPKSYNATRQRLYQMSKAGEIKSVGDGLYTAP